MDKEFNSVEEIDAALAEEFAKDMSTQPVNEATEVDKVAETPDTTQTQVTETPENKTKEVDSSLSTGIAKQEHAFAKLRDERNKAIEEKTAAEKTLSKKQAIMERLAKASGFDTVESYEEALQEKLYEAEAKVKGTDPKTLAELEKKEARIKELEEAQTKSAQEGKLQQFVQTIDKVVKENGLSEEDGKNLIAKFSEDGFTLEQLLSVPHYEYMIQGALAPVIQAKASAAKKEAEKLSGIDTKTPLNTTVQSDSLKELLDKEMALYAKQRGIPLD